MIRYLHHPLRKYRIFSLKTIKRLKWRDAIPELEERMRIEKDQDIKKEVQQTIEAIQTFVGRTSTESLGGAQKQPHMYTLGHEVTCKVIPIRCLRKKGTITYDHEGGCRRLL
jgi:hypothetical protein